MNIKIFDMVHDDVIKSHVLFTKSNYQDALIYLFPLIDRFEQQRNPLNKSFYEKLRKDLINGCIMPPITVALLVDDLSVVSRDINECEKYISENIKDGFILDGIQRLNTMHLAKDEGLPLEKPIYINVLISTSIDMLLYRMITLNNGQKPMSARHQVEILASNRF